MARFLVRSIQEQFALVATLERDRSRRQRWEAISATAAGFAHKLATPLNNVKIRLRRLEALNDPCLSDDLRSAAQSLGQAEAHLKAIVANSLERSQGEAIRFQTIDLREFLVRFASAQSEEGMPVIASAVEAMKLGCAEYLTKPVDVDVLEQKLTGASHANDRDVPPLRPSLAKHEREYIEFVIRECEDNISRAARELGIHRQSLQRKLRKYPSKI